GQALYPQKMNAAFSMTRNEMAALPQKLNEARQNAAVYIDCPLDFESIIVNAFSRAISAEGFPVSKTRSAAAAVCTITVDEGMQKRELGVFYFPSVQAVFAEKGTPLFSYSASADSASAVTPDVAKRRAYKALEEEIQRTFSLSGAGY
ncbi:MAG: hypothetical protein LBQ88_01935, partial [Treponema sp.]|nr:hypothetical protein [Treponema sp.]